MPELVFLQSNNLELSRENESCTKIAMMHDNVHSDSVPSVRNTIVSPSFLKPMWPN